MEKQLNIQNKTQIYAKIPLQRRVQLVEEVLKNDTPISIISKRLGVKLSTAKLIVKKYKEEGVFFEKRSNRLERLALEKRNQQKKGQEYSKMPQQSREVNVQKPLNLLPSYTYVLNPQQMSIHAESMFIVNNPFLQSINGNLAFYYPSTNYFYSYA